MQSERRDRWVSAAKVHRQMRMRREISVILTGDGAARAVEVERRSAWVISAGRLEWSAGGVVAERARRSWMGLTGEVDGMGGAGWAVLSQEREEKYLRGIASELLCNAHHGAILKR